MLTTFTFFAFLVILGRGFCDYELRTWSSQIILENEKETIEIENLGNLETINCAACEVRFCSAGNGRRCYSSPYCCLNTLCWKVRGFKKWCLKNGYLDYL